MVKKTGMIHVRGTYMYEIDNQQPSTVIKGKGSTTILERSTLEIVETEALFFFYCLIDPNTNLVRYIGRTVNPKSRLRHHMYETRKQNRTRKQRWINKLGKTPILRILHNRICTLSEAILIEKRLVTWFKTKTNLTNEPDAYLGTVNVANPIHQYTLSGKYITTYVNKHRASIDTGIKDCNIGRAVKTNKSAGGYLWSNLKKDSITPYTKLKPTKAVLK